HVRRLTMTANIRGALIGCGRHGRYLSGALRQVEGVTWAACADVAPGAADRLSHDLGYAVAYTDARTMLDKEKPDAVIVATSHAQLAPAALMAIQAGCSLFVEKPLALNAAQ